MEEFDGDRDEAVEQYGEDIVAKVNFETGRVRPSFSLDASVGLTLIKSGDSAGSAFKSMPATSRIA